jgi:adenylate cyclase
LAIGIVLSLRVARLISRSLSSLTASARQIGDLQLHAAGKVHSRVAEINTLAGALGAARQAIGTFALYVPRELVRKIVASGQAAVGSAVRQEVTVLFTDIRDFTTISESRSPEEVVALLTSYFELMNGIVERHNGVIVQYLGDSIYAMWNAPEPDPDHVDDGCRCTLALKAGIDELNRANRAAGLPELVTRFGLHVGEAVVGSVGARSRRQYTAMGDTVNVASRLEGINKQFGTSILVSGAVRARADPGFFFRALGKAQAKGRAEQIDIFELVGFNEDYAAVAASVPSDAAAQQTGDFVGAGTPLLQ